MADVKKLKDLLETYGVGVRAGVITPCLADENLFREKLGLGQAPAEVVKDWGDSEGVRRPITLQRPSQTEEMDETTIESEDTTNNEQET